jgi:hypothetical protein
VVLVIANGDVPIASVEVIWPVADSVVNAPLAGALLPIPAGDAHVALSS